ncbi:MAG: acetyl-CoA synthase subunit gamma [Nitrospirae bacterium]|nr:acetyl-CoA synthase subunit gamma [Nitrospirota bacterium]
MTASGPVEKVSTRLSSSDYLGHIRCRTTAFRNNYTIPPGIYAAGQPGEDSDILVSSNYKLSFDALRKELEGLNVWILVLDTRGINVWCAAGKGTFGTEELLRRISSTGIEHIVSHRRLIVPQLGAPGVSAYKVKRASGFTVCFGPVRARDLKEFIARGYRATDMMRTVSFPIYDRLVLTPMEIVPAMKNYPVYVLIVLVISGLHPDGILFRDAIAGGIPLLLLGLVAILAGAFITPLLLPYIPSRSFAVKGWIAGIFFVFPLVRFTWPDGGQDPILLGFSCLFFPMVSSYVALQFTGSTTFTGMSGVKKELRTAVPVYIVSGVISLVLLIIHKIAGWGPL